MKQDTANGRAVVVIGAGIVGMSCAFQLQKRGYTVTVVDPEPPGEACSFGNAGVIAASFCCPIVTPATLRSTPRWLLDPNSFISMDPRYIGRLLPWLVQGIRAASGNTIERLGQALADLHRTAVDDHMEQAREAECAHLLERTRYLYLYEKEGTFQGDRLHWEMRRRNGWRYEELDPRAVPEIEPSLSASFAHAILMDGHGVALDPGGLVKGLAAAFEKRQGRVLPARVKTVGAGAPEAGRAVEIATDTGEIQADHVVIAAGAWSAELGRMLGYRFPLVAERGYHVSFREPGFALRQPVMFADYKFVANSMHEGVRCAGTVEFAPLTKPPSERRYSMLRATAERLIPALRGASGHRYWVGARPSLPDTLPVIGRSRRDPRIYFAFGHGHTGLTAAPITGRIIADLISGQAPPIDIAPFSPDRFQS